MREIMLYKAFTNMPTTAGAENLISSLDSALDLKGFFPWIEATLDI